MSRVGDERKDCAGPCCRRDVPIAEFAIKKGKHTKKCRLCENARVREHRKTAGWQLWRAKNRKKNAEASKRWRDRNPEKMAAQRAAYILNLDPAWEAERRKARSLLVCAMRQGRMKRGLACEKCDLIDPLVRLVAHFWRGREHPLDVQWLCRPHHYAVRRAMWARSRLISLVAEREAAVAGALARSANANADPQVLEALTCDPEEWRYFHEQHKVQLAREASALVVIEAREGKRAAYLHGIYFDAPPAERKEIVRRIMAEEALL